MRPGLNQCRRIDCAPADRLQGSGTVAVLPATAPAEHLVANGAWLVHIVGALALVALPGTAVPAPAQGQLAELHPHNPFAEFLTMAPRVQC